MDRRLNKGTKMWISLANILFSRKIKIFLIQAPFSVWTKAFFRTPAGWNYCRKWVSRWVYGTPVWWNRYRVVFIRFLEPQRSGNIVGMWVSRWLHGTPAGCNRCREVSMRFLEPQRGDIMLFCVRLVFHCYIYITPLGFWLFVLLLLYLYHPSGV